MIGAFVCRKCLPSSFWLVRSLGYSFMFTLLLGVACAQDSRNVTEPSFPPSCTVLMANQMAGSLNETSFDTARIQSALNS